MSIETKRLQSLQFRQVEATLATWRNARLPARPPGGWVRTVREALGMPAAALARRLGMTPAGLRRLEQTEAQQVITLASLHKLADSLGCELQYALVPRQPLAQQLEARARQLADERLRPVAHSMALEDQAVQGASGQMLRELLVQELLAGPRSKLW
jgi:predicted DNA-binding mobile mystery protein A